MGLTLVRPQVARATHIRAGDIQTRADRSVGGNPNHIFFRLTIYRDKGSRVPQGLVDTYIFFGDNSALHGTDQDASGQPLMTRTVDPVLSTADTEVLYFDFEHTYGGAGSYPVGFIGEYRNENIINMANSVSTSFYIETRVIINPAYGAPNRSPMLLAPAVDKAGLGQVYLHNPAAYDADGDSLAFSLRDCQQVKLGNRQISDLATSTNKIITPVPCDNYVYPDNQILAPGAKQVSYMGVPAGNPINNAILVQDPYTGQITWNAPARIGIYNIAFNVEEWRRTPTGRRIRIGNVIRDMQIIVSATNNLPPTLTVPPDLCVVAGTPVSLTVTATDGTAAGALAPTPVSLFAYSGILPPATFTQVVSGTTTTGTFRWTPDCSNVSNQPYTVVFKAQDSPPAGSGAPILIDEKPVRITVVGPPPQNVRGTPATLPSGNSVSLITWDRYTCQNASQLLIFRKEGAYNFTPGPCETGLPAGSGYVQVGTVSPTATTFTDTNGDVSLSRGKTYCYRVYAVFPLPAGGTSIVSNETCVTFSGRAARLTNVDVNTTSTAGQITVKWSQPRADNGGTFGAPYGYRLSRAVGASGAFTPLATITNLTDTTYLDRGVNTLASQYTYQLTFFSADRTETAATASSVRTTLLPNADKTITVSWTYQVPWDNTKQPARIFRQNPGSTAFAQVGTVVPGASSGTYTDRDPALQFGRQYCYYVQTNGQYPDLLNSANQPIFVNLLNNSQRQCVQLNAVPCTPVLTLRQTNCDSLASSAQFPRQGQQYQNNLSWSVGNTPTNCSSAAAYYRILRGEVAGGPYVAIDSTQQLRYAHRFLTQASGCYVVQAVDSTGLRSAFSNVACQSECVFFLLPNIFTPNGDNTNETFRPKTSSPLRHTRIQVFNRWGRKVYESDQDPYINWTGGGAAGESSTSSLVSNGLYYYLADVEFADSASTRRTFKGWVELMR
jgi:gliding motility-associated-like protein